MLLLAVRADNGQPRSYLVNSILGARPTQQTFAPRYPIELTPGGPQAIPQSTRSAARSLDPQLSGDPSTFQSCGDGGPTYVFRCPVCKKTFNRKSYDATARPHKNQRGGDCHGSYLTYVRTTS